MSIDQVFVISTSITFSLLINFAQVFRILKEGKWENCIKTSTKILLLFFSLVLPWLPVYTNRETTFTKTFCFVLLSCLNYLKKTTKEKQTYNDLLCSERTLLYCLNVHLFTSTWFMKNIKEEKMPEDRPSGWWLRG